MIESYRFLDDVTELAAVGEMVAKAAESGPKNVAVLARNNATLDGLSLVLTKLGVPHQHLGKRRARLDQEVVRGCVAYPRVALNPADDFALARALRCPLRESIRAKTFDHRMREAAAGGSLFAALVCAESWAFPDELSALVTFRTHLFALSESLSGEEWSRGLDGLWGHLADAHRAGGFTTKADEIEWLRTVLRDFAAGRIRGNRKPERSARGFLFWILHGQGAGEHDPEADVVTLSTVHLFKGLETGTVFFPGLVERVLPSSQSIDAAAIGHAEAIDEELRVWFVGCTRARDRLVVTSCASIRSQWDGLPFSAEPSRFLEHLKPC